MENKDYTTKELAELFGVSIRTIQRHLATLVRQSQNTVIVPFDIVQVLLSRHKYDTSTTLGDNENNEDDDTADVIWEYTNEEFAELQKTLIEYPMLKEQVGYLKEQIEYHKNSVLNHQKQIDKILNTIEQKNYIDVLKIKSDTSNETIDID